MTTMTTTKITAATVVTDGAKIIADYVAGDAKIKGAIRANVTKIVMDAIDTLDLSTMAAAKIVLDGLKITKPVAVVDPKIAAQAIVDLQATVAAMIADATPETIMAMHDDDAPLTGNVVTKIAKVSTGTRAPGRSLQIAFDDMDLAGTGTILTVAQIMKATGLVSSGAISSRLFPADGGVTTLDGVDALDVGDDATDADGNAFVIKARSARFV